VGVAVGIRVDVEVGVGVRVRVNVAVAVRVGVIVGVAVGGGFTVVVTLAESFVEFGSHSAASTLAVLVMTPAAFGRT
jgi:hypothetical protein